MILRSLNSDADYRDTQDSHPISDVKGSTKTLGLEWKTCSDQFHLTISQSIMPDVLTKQVLVSDIARIFDILGWFSPIVIEVKVLLQ